MHQGKALTVVEVLFILRGITVGLATVSIVNYQVINSQDNTFYLFFCYSKSADVWWTVDGRILSNFNGTDLVTQHKVEGAITSVYSYISTLLGSRHMNEHLALLTTLVIFDYKNGSNFEVTCSNILDSAIVCAEQINGVSPLNSNYSDAVILEYLSSTNLSAILNASFDIYLCTINQTFMNWQVDNEPRFGHSAEDKFAVNRVFLSMDNSLVHKISVFLGSNLGRILTLLLVKSDDNNNVTCSSTERRSLSNKHNSLEEQSSDISSFRECSKMDRYTNTVGEQFLNETVSEGSETEDGSGTITINHLGVIIGFTAVFAIFILFAVAAGGIIMYCKCCKTKKTIRNDSHEADNLDEKSSFWSVHHIFSCFIRLRHNWQTPGTA